MAATLEHEDGVKASLRIPRRTSRSSQGSVGEATGFLEPPSPGRRNIGRRHRKGSVDLPSIEYVVSSPGRNSAVSRLTDRKITALPITFHGSVSVIKYSLMSFYTPLSLLITYTIFYAMPATELHRVGIAQRAAITAMMSERKKQQAATRKMLTTYKVYNFRPLSSASPTMQSDERAIQALMSDSRASKRRTLAPDAAAAMVTYTTLYPWRMRRHNLRVGSAVASGSSVDNEPFLSAHTAARLSMSAAEVAEARSPSVGASSADILGKGAGFALPPAQAVARTPAQGAARAAAVGRSRSVVDLQSCRAGSKLAAPAVSGPPRSGDGGRRGSPGPATMRRGTGSGIALAAAGGRASPAASTGMSPRMVRYHPSLASQLSPPGRDSPVPLAIVGDSVDFPAPAALRVARIRARPIPGMHSPQGGTGQAAATAPIAHPLLEPAAGGILDASGSTGAS